MKKIEIMTNRLDKRKESVSITVPGTRKNIRLHAEIREQEEKVKMYWRKRGIPIWLKSRKTWTLYVEFVVTLTGYVAEWYIALGVITFRSLIKNIEI